MTFFFKTFFPPLLLFCLKCLSTENMGTNSTIAVEMSYPIKGKIGNN